LAVARYSEIRREIEKFIIRKPPMEEKDDYDSENSWISDSKALGVIGSFIGGSV